MDKAKLIAILDECIDQEKLAKKLAVEVAIPLLKEAAAKSETKVDDAVVALLVAALEKLAE